MKTSSKRRPALGRPPKPPEAVRSNRVVTFVTNAEMEELEQLADEQGSALSAVVYKLLAKSLSELR